MEIRHLDDESDDYDDVDSVEDEQRERERERSISYKKQNEITRFSNNLVHINIIKQQRIIKVHFDCTKFSLGCLKFVRRERGQVTATHTTTVGITTLVRFRKSFLMDS